MTSDALVGLGLTDRSVDVVGIASAIAQLQLARQAELDAIAGSRDTMIEAVQDRSKRLTGQIKSFFNL